ncbi:MAG TPA: PQQ-dependent sugar dehydrogenase, partial [Thermoanaerobaculia bacterium]|nr:PQQ-dependent sugar dehydrogenase [Thermoanaerobaculia bacterium]
MLRIDVDNGTPYAIPASNPFRNQSGARPEIWAYGLRNPWRFTFDRENGDLWIADVGQNQFEEVDLQRASSVGGENYGWRRMEGTHCFNPAANCNIGGTLVLPIIEYSHAGGACSVTGGYRYRGTKYPRLRGMYLYADYCEGTIYAATENGSTWSTRLLLDTNVDVTTFGEDVAGELYVAGAGDTGLYAITDAEPLGPKRRAVK